VSPSKDKDDQKSKSGYGGFEWDDKKSDWTLEERGFDFDFAARIWSESPVWERESTQQRDERRFIAIGIVEGSTIAVVWTPRGTDRRIISPDRLPERNASNMARRSNAQIEHGKGRVNWDKVHATSDEEIERQRQADGDDVADDDDGLIVVTAAYVRRIREKLGLTQSQFADQFGLNQRTVQEWEADRSRVGTGQGGAGRSGTYPAARY